MAIETTTQPTPESAADHRLIIILTFLGFVIIWISLLAGAFLSIWTIADVRDLTTLMVGLMAGALMPSPTNVLSRVTTRTPS